MDDRLRNLASLTGQISSFNFYSYDQSGSSQYQIVDGGSDMYDNGNIVCIIFDPTAYLF